MYSIYAGSELLYSDVYPLDTRKVTSPTLKMGVDEAGSLEFTVNEVNKCYTKLQRMKTIITVKKLNPKNHQEEPIWDGRILREDRDFYKNRKIYVEGALAFLNDSCQPLKEYANKDLQALVTDILNEHNKIVQDEGRNLYWGGIGGDFKPPQIEYWSTKYEYTIDTIKELAEYLECHFVVKKNPANNHNEIWFFKEDCGSSEQSIVFTKNLMDYTENYDLSKLATVLLPLCQTDRESSDKPINIGTSIDLTTPKPCGEDGCGVFCPLSVGWVQDYSPQTAKYEVGRGHGYTYTGGDYTNSRYDSFHIDVDPSTLEVDSFTSELKTLKTPILPVGQDSNPYPHIDTVRVSFRAYRFFVEDKSNTPITTSSPMTIKTYLYYQPKNSSSDTWTRFDRDGVQCSGWGLYNDQIIGDRRWPHTWYEPHPLLAFEVYNTDSEPTNPVPDTDTYDWAIQVVFTLPSNETWDVDQTTFKDRIRFCKLFACAGVKYESMTGKIVINESGWYQREVTNPVNKSLSTGIYADRVLNLKRFERDGHYYGTPWSFSYYPLTCYSFDTSTYEPFVGPEYKIFNGSIDVRLPVDGVGNQEMTYFNLSRFSRDPVQNVQDKTLTELLGPAGAAAFINSQEGLNRLQSLNYGLLKYHPLAMGVGLPRVAVLEIDLDKYKSYFLTASNYRSLLPDDMAYVASVWKIKDDNTLDDWIPIKGRDGDVNNGFEYHIMSHRKTDGTNDEETLTPFVSLSANRSASLSRMTREDLVVNDPDTVYVLNPAKYEFVSCDTVTRRCFEKEMFLTDDPGPGYSRHILLCLYSCEADLSVTLATEEELYSVLAVGQDPNGIDKSKENPMRHAEEEPHTYSDDPVVQNHVFNEELGYGTLVPPTEGYRLPDQSEMAAIGTPFPNVWEEGGYYHTPFEFSTHGTDGIVRQSLTDTNYKVCVFFAKPSYVDENGKQCTRSIYISTSMYKKPAIYAIFELSMGDGSAAKWKDKWTAKCRAIEYGKYINGYTTYDKKKITLPTCKDKDTLLEVFVASYGSEPSIWLHDPELTNKMSYLTIGAANNGEIRLYADQINMFTSSIEQGGLNDQNGSTVEPPSYLRVRTRDFMTVKTTGSYALTFKSDIAILANVYVYDQNEEFKYSTGFTSLSPVIFLPTMMENDKVKVEFMIGPTTSGIQPSYVKYPQLYALNGEPLAHLSQGPLKATLAPGAESYEVAADPSDANASIFVSTSDYYVAKSTDKIKVRIDPNTIPKTIEVEGVVKDVVSSQFYMTVVYQIPHESLTSYEIAYDNYYIGSESYGIGTFTPPKINARFKIQVRIQVGYMNGDTIVYTNAPITPDTISNIILTPLTTQDYYPPSNALETYGRIEKRIEFEDAESSQELLERAKKYLRQSQFDEMELKVKALDMTLMGAEVDNLHVADKINVSSPPHGVYKDFIIREMSISFDKPENTTFELGWDNKESLSKLIRKEKSKW